jgi:hypothetical protein
VVFPWAVFKQTDIKDARIFLFQSGLTHHTTQGKVGSMAGLNTPKHVAYVV